MPRPGDQGNRILIIVQNLPVPLDRRVWLECQALRSQGYEVSVICPKGPGDPAYHVVDGVHLYKYAPAPDASGLAGFAREFSYSWLRTALLSLKVRRQRGFDVIQACNPPDTYWLLALLWRLRGVRFVFDQHDLNPELFVSRFGKPVSIKAKLLHAALLWLERRTYRAADHVISTNGSYRSIAIARGRRSPGTVTVVRSGPDTRRMRPVVGDGTKAPGTFVLAYLGIMGPQDGVDGVLEIVDELVNRRGRTGVRAVLMGFGDCLADLKEQATALRLDAHVTFTGRVGPAEIARQLSAADIGVGPDQLSPLNDLSTMNKTMEYMAFALPTVSYDLKETRVSAGDCGVFVPSGDVSAFADAVEALMGDDERRVEMGVAARERVVTELDWQEQAKAYVTVFDELTNRPPTAERLGRWPFTAPAEAAEAPDDLRWVDVDDAAAFREFLSSRRGRAAEVPRAGA